MAQSQPDRSRELFDALTEAAYRGHAFRDVLRTDPKAFEAARVLTESLRKAGVIGDWDQSILPIF